jgi:hypothetical protein
MRLYRSRLEINAMSQARNSSTRKFDVELLENRLVPNATTFVTSLYTNLLNRAPDAAGLAGWVNLINSGAASNQQVATAIWDSAEHRAVEVTGYYVTLLRRNPDAPGLNNWVNLMLNGTLNEQGVETAFVTSTEYINNHPTQDLYIAGLYRDILGRLPSIAEINLWLPTLNLSGTVFVAEAFITSTERFVDVIDFYYISYLNRSPDIPGLNGWLFALQTNQATVESVAEAILGSAEYAQKH